MNNYMKIYRVSVVEERGGYIFVEAKDESTANQKVLEMLDDEGIPKNAEITYRSFDTLEIEEQ